MQSSFTTPTEAVKRFVEAVETNNEQAAREASDEGAFGMGPVEGPGPYFQRLVRTGTTLKILAHLIKATDLVAVVPTAAHRKGFPTAPVLFFLEHLDGRGWYIVGLTRSTAYARKVIAGEAPAMLDMTKLPPEPDIVPFAERIIARYDGDVDEALDVPGIATLIRRWRSEVDAKPGDTYVKRTVQVPWFDRAAILFAHRLPTREEKMWMVAHRHGARWSPVWFGRNFEPSTLFLKLD